MSAGMWILLTIVLGVVAHGLFLFAIPHIAKSGDVKVERYFEGSLNYLPLVDGSDEDRERAANAKPPQLPPLREFARFRDKEADKYVSPLMFPLDLVMMIFMSAFLAIGCVTFGSYVPLAANRTWLLITPAVLYFVFDIVEDTLLAWFLKNPDAISFERVHYLKLLTAGKLMSITAANLELAVLFVLAAWRGFKPA
jgi:hypothetical protein